MSQAPTTAPVSLSPDSSYWREQAARPGSLISPSFVHHRDAGYVPNPSFNQSRTLGYAGASWLYLTVPPTPPSSLLRSKFTNNLWHQGEIPISHRALFASAGITHFLNTSHTLTFNSRNSPHSALGTPQHPFFLSHIFATLDYTSNPVDRLPVDASRDEILNFLHNLSMELLGQVPSDSTIPFAHTCTPFIWSHMSEWDKYTSLPSFYLGLLLSPTPSLRSLLPIRSDLSTVFIAIAIPPSSRFVL